MNTLQDHSRTKLLELWNQKIYMRNHKCHHMTAKHPKVEQRIVFQGMVDDQVVLQIWYDKDAKNKVRSFYRFFFTLMAGFFEDVEKRNSIGLMATDKLVKMIETYKSRHFRIKPEELNCQFGLL